MPSTPPLQVETRRSSLCFSLLAFPPPCIFDERTHSQRAHLSRNRRPRPPPLPPPPHLFSDCTPRILLCSNPPGSPIHSCQTPRRTSFSPCSASTTSSPCHARGFSRGLAAGSRRGGQRASQPPVLLPRRVGEEAKGRRGAGGRRCRTLARSIYVDAAREDPNEIQLD